MKSAVKTLLDANMPNEFTSYSKPFKGLTIRQFARSVGATYHFGANTHALVFDSAVIKWDRDEYMRISSHKRARALVDVYNDLAIEWPSLTPHLAEVMRYKGVTIQERIRPFYDSEIPDSKLPADVSDEELHDIYLNVMDVAIRLGIGDMHTGNWGYRAGDKETPVLFDLSGYGLLGENWYDLNLSPMWHDRWGVGEDYEESLEDAFYQMVA
jgi:hypothetical protein